jgi:hypothetical protein
MVEPRLQTLRDGVDMTFRVRSACDRLCDSVLGDQLGDIPKVLRKRELP